MQAKQLSISLPLTVPCNVVSCLANVLPHTHNDVAHTGGGGIVLHWGRRQSASLSTVMMCSVVSSSSDCCHYCILANFAHFSQNLPLLYDCCHIYIYVYIYFIYINKYIYIIYLLIHCIIRYLILLTFLLSDRADDDRAGDCCEPACWGVGSDPGVGDHPTAHVRPWLDGHEEPGEQLLPQFCHASALHRSRLPEQVSTL